MAWSRRGIIAGLAALISVPAKADECERYRDALERIALLDEADGHYLKLKHAFEATAIASQALGKHPSLILVDREARLRKNKQ